jgi:anti-sigma factor RsiW
MSENCEACRSDLLLAADGDLPPARRAELDRHLAECAACRAFGEGAVALQNAAARALPADGPSPVVLRRIRAAAADAVGGAPRSRLWVFRSPAARVLAYAAGLTLLAGSWGYWQHAVRANRLAHLSAALAFVTDTTPASLETDAAEPSRSREEILRELARGILRMQGLADDSAVDSGLTGFEAPDSTGPQSRSNPAWPAAWRG